MEEEMKNLKSIFALGVMIYVGLTGCAPKFPKVMFPNLPKSQMTAGTVTVSAYPAMLWDDIADELKPNFTVANADVALAMVLPYTYTDELQRSRRFGANVQVNLAGTATPAIKTAKETASTGEKSGDTNATGVTKGTTDSKTQGTQPTSSATAPSSSIAAPGQANKAFEPGRILFSYTGLPQHSIRR